MKGRVLKTKALLLGAVRKRSSTVVNIPPSAGIGLGNMLAYWFWASRERKQGVKAYVQRTDAMEKWLDVFPQLNELTVHRRDLRFTDGRIHWMDQEFRERDRPALESFVRDYLLTSPRWPSQPPCEAAVVTVNVRRGDYYSNPGWRALYGFDVPAYVRVAMEGAAAQAPIEVVRVVSDGPQWCREHLGFLSNFGSLEFQAPGDGPEENLLQLSSARRLILANSTFSYWAGYMSNTWHRDNHSLVWAPWFHRRDFNEGGAWHLDPRWSVVRDIPGGW